MKRIILFATLICLTAAAPSVNEGLQNDIADFLEIIPVEKIKKIAVQHLHDDLEFQAAIKYMKSPEWVEMVTELEASPEIIEFNEFLKEAGLNFDEYGAKIYSVFKDAVIETDHKERSLKGFIADVRQIIPLAKLIETFDQKMNNSPAFKEFYDKITSEKAHVLVSKIRALPVFQKLVAEINVMGVDLDRFFKIIYAVFGWTDEVVTPAA